MPRKKPSSAPGTRRYGTNTHYSAQDLQEALNKITSDQISQREAARVYKIPRSTIKYKLRGQHNKNVGRPTVFSSEEEAMFVEHILAVSDIGIPVSMYDVRCIIKQYLNNIGRKVSTFSHNMPGWEWGKLFLERHPNLNAKFAANISRKRAQINETAINNFFDNLEIELKDIPPENIYNFDETGYHDVPKKGKVLFRRSCRHPEVVRNSTKSCFTVMYCGNAAGELLPPYFIYKAKHKWSDWLYNAPSGSRLNVSKSGWIDSEVFDDWFATHLLPELKKKVGTKVVIGDNLSSHISLSTLKLCREHDVKFICLLPNATHILQPLDVGFFSPLKTHWRTVLLQWRQTQQGKKAVSLPNNIFAQLVKKALALGEDKVSTNLINGFKATGIYPLSREHVIAKLPSYAQPENIQAAIGEEFKTYIEGVRNSDLAVIQRGRKFQLPVLPGKSVSVEEVEQYYRNREMAASCPKQPRKRGRPKKNTVENGSSSDSNDTESEMEFVASDSTENNGSEINEQDQEHMILESVASTEKSPGVLPTIIISENKEFENSMDDDLMTDEILGEYTVTEGCLVKEGETSYNVGSYVIIKYENLFYPGLVTQVFNPRSYKISAMEKSGSNWKWPKRKDEIIYDITDIVKLIKSDSIVPVSNRGMFAISDELLK